jgi:AcrR family transcriptional regulator
MSIRDEQVALTRNRILDAVVELSGDPNVDSVSVAEVSRRSGVAPATIYRHFPTRDEMVAAAALDRLRQYVDRDAGSWGLEEMRAHLLTVWTELSNNLPLARQATVSELGREMRLTRFGRTRPMTHAAIRSLGKDPDDPHVRKFVACMEVLQSAHAFLDFHDRQGLAAEEAVDAAAWAITVMASAVGIDANTFRISLPATTISTEDHQQ